MVGKTGPRQLFLFLDAGIVRMGNTRNCKDTKCYLTIKMTKIKTAHDNAVCLSHLLVNVCTWIEANSVDLTFGEEASKHFSRRLKKTTFL